MPPLPSPDSDSGLILENRLLSSRGLYANRKFKERPLKKFLSDWSQSSTATLKKLSEMYNNGVESVSGFVGQLPLIGSVEAVNEQLKFDEKHYFVVPYRLSPVRYTLHSMRVLPQGTGPVNDLPKKRIFHFPDKGAESIIEELLMGEVATEVAKSNESSPTANKLIDLANEIDRVETKVTGGMLLVGGLVALVNPVVGAGLALSAALPKLGGALSSMGLKSWGERWNEKALAKELKSAQEKVLTEFRSGDTSYEINPLLKQLDLALDTTVEQFQPDPQLVINSYQTNVQTTRLTCKAIYDVYLEVMNSEKLRKQASIGPEDIEWLNQVARIATDKREEQIDHRISLFNTQCLAVKETLSDRGHEATLGDLEAIETLLPNVLRLHNVSRSTGSVIDEIVDELIPTAINAYLALGEKPEVKFLESGKTGEELFIQQISAARQTLETLLTDAKSSDVRTLEIQMRYINGLIN